jgi:putative effector of murein hydrolase
MEVSNATGGIPSLTAAVVVMVGLFGAVFGFKVLNMGQVKSPIAQGLSMGTASHAIGTSAAMEMSRKYGAYASLGLTLNGILTSILAPMVLRLMGII